MTQPNNELQEYSAFVEATSAKHYSDQILDELIAAHGWQPLSHDDVFNRSKAQAANPRIGVYKNVGGLAAGELNPNGSNVVSASFDEERSRYLELSSGWNTPFDIDCRDQDVKLIAKVFNERTSQLAVEKAVDKSTLKVVPLKPHEMNFELFSKLAIFTPLENHGRMAHIQIGDDWGFADSKDPETAKRQAHSGYINNAIYTNTPDAAHWPEADKCSFPSLEIIDEYPALVERWDDVLKARLTAKEGTYTGKIMSVGAGQVAQKSGRDPQQLKYHDVSTLTFKPKVGDVVEIQYQKGIGKVIGRTPEIER